MSRARPGRSTSSGTGEPVKDGGESRPYHNAHAVLRPEACQRYRPRFEGRSHTQAARPGRGWADTGRRRGRDEGRSTHRL